MSDLKFGERAWRLLRIVVTCGVILGGLLMRVSHAQEKPSSFAAALGGKRVHPSEVSLSNVEAFEAQMRRDLPLGTPKANVEAYLKCWSIPYFFADADGTPTGNAFYGTLMKIGKKSKFTGHLAIRIFLDEEDKIREIVFRIDYR